MAYINERQSVTIPKPCEAWLWQPERQDLRWYQVY